MNKIMSDKFKYIRVMLNEKLARWGEKHAYRKFQNAKKALSKFNDMGCLGNPDNGVRVCAHFDEDYECCHDICPMQKLNIAYVDAYAKWCSARKDLMQANSIVNAVLEDKVIRKVK